MPAAEYAFRAIGLPVNTRGLDIADVRARLGVVGDKRVLMVEGDVVNLLPNENASPDLRISLLAADGRELYVWTTHGPRGHLNKGERARFAARLETPPDGVEEAMVRLAPAKSPAARSTEGS